MLRTVLADFVRAIRAHRDAPEPGATSPRDGIPNGRRVPLPRVSKESPIDGRRNLQVGVPKSTEPGPHFTSGVEALVQIPPTAGNEARMIALCDRIESTNPYIPSAFKGILEFKRFQAELLRGNRSGAIDRLRMAIAQVPYEEELLGKYKSLVPQGHGSRDVALIISCKKYEGKALALAGQFDRAGIEYRVISGNDTQPITHRWAVQVKAADDYESLPRKVAAAYTWVYETMGSNVGIVKIDDDQTLSDAALFRTRIAELHSRDAYAGVPVSGVTHDRNWHWNKCKDPALNTRTYGRPYFRAWAMGGAYYLGPGPLEKIVLFLMRFPGMFEGEYFEDKLVGDVLHFEATPLEPLPSYEYLGMVLRDAHRFSVA